MSELGAVVEAGHRDLNARDDGQLIRGRRHAVLRALGDGDAGRARRARLARDTVEHVLPRWQAVRPGDHDPQKLLAQIDGVLDGTVDAADASRAAGTLWAHADNLILTTGPEPPLLVGYAASKALTAALRDEPLDPPDADPELTDFGRDPPAARHSLHRLQRGGRRCTLGRRLRPKGAAAVLGVVAGPRRPGRPGGPGRRLSAPGPRSAGLGRPGVARSARRTSFPGGERDRPVREDGGHLQVAAERLHEPGKRSEVELLVAKCLGRGRLTGVERLVDHRVAGARPAARLDNPLLSLHQPLVRGHPVLIQRPLPADGLPALCELGRRDASPFPMLCRYWS